MQSDLESFKNIERFLQEVNQHSKSVPVVLLKSKKLDSAHKEL